ncbi:tetratricopeptide repeat protein [Sulfurospirillum sp. 1612]|uniref:tetratricopeptide repeat protein n=1 Tax=Sulfurospirillum sp. 1612 TaxID=3094835 RepID=UPI002F9589DC
MRLLSILLIFTLYGVASMAATLPDSAVVNKQAAGEQEEELKLMLQSFLFKNDLTHAYQVAQKGYQKYPNSYFWNDNLAKIARWTGHSQIAIKHMMFLYRHKPSKALRNQIITYGLSFYQYDKIKHLIVAQTLENPSKKHIDTLVYIFYQVGEPQKAATILMNLYQKDPTKTEYLTKALRVYLDAGELDAASKVVALIDAKHAYNRDNIAMVSYFYYLKRDMKHAYDILLQIQESKIPPNAQYYALLSDIGWYLQDFKRAVDASLNMIHMDKGRLVDFERVVQFKQTSNPLLSASIAKEGYEKFHVAYLFYIYANNLIALNHYDELHQDIDRLVAINPEVSKQVNYWLIRASLYLHYKQTALATEAIKKAITIDPESEENKLALLYFMTDYHLNHDLRELLKRMDESSEKQETLYFPMASAYLFLQNVNKADFYAQKLIRMKNPIIKSVEFEFMQAYIYQLQSKTNAFSSKMRGIEKQLDTPDMLQQTDVYWNTYLNAAMYVLQADYFEKKLSDAKPYLTQTHYKELSYSWAVRHKAFERSHQLYRSMTHPELWLKLSNAMIMTHHTNIENLLKSYTEDLPRGEASVAAENDGQIALSQDLNYDALNTNRYGQNAYIHHLDLSKKRSNLLEIKGIFQENKPLVQEGAQIDHRLYLGEGWHLLNGLEVLKNRTTNDDTLMDVPATTSQFDVGFKKEFDARAYVIARVGFRDVMKRYFTYELHGHYKAHSRVSVDLGLYKNRVADENNLLILSGNKDSMTLGVDWQILRSTQIGIRTEYNQYHAQDGDNLGTGQYGRIFINRRLREGYPDISTELFADFGTYQEKSGSHNLVRSLQRTPDRILPEDFYNIGLVLRYGYVNSEIYTRVWRPFFETGLYYNNRSQGLGYGFEAGYGGKIWNQDHLSVGINYSNSVNGTNDTIMRLFVRYQFLYTHP